MLPAYTCAALHFHDDGWELLGESHFEAGPDGSEYTVGWLLECDSTMNMVTVSTPPPPPRRRNKAPEPPKTETYNVKTLLPHLEHLKSCFDTCMRVVVSVCLPPDDDTPKFVAQVRVFVHAKQLQSMWEAVGSVPCLSDLFELFWYYDLEPPIVPAPRMSCVADAKEWLLEMSERPPSFAAPSQASLFPIPGTTIVADRERMLLRSNTSASWRSQMCKRAVLAGPLGAGKFAACLAATLSIPPPTAPTPRTHVVATLVIVPAGAISWRLACIQKHAPAATVCVLCTKADVQRAKWESILQADFVVVSAQLLSSKFYTQHMHDMLHALTHDPRTYGVAVAETYAPKPHVAAPPGKKSNKRPRREELDIGVPVQTFKFPATTAAASVSASKLTPFLCTVARRVLQASILPWESFHAPVLEALSYARAIFVDCDKYPGSQMRMQLFSADAAWATTSFAESALFLLPADVAKSFLHNSLTAHLEMPAKKATRKQATRHHVKLPMTPRESLRHVGSCRLHLDPLYDTSTHGVAFVARDAMADSVMKVAEQHLSAMRTRRNMLQSELSRENVSAFVTEYPEMHDADEDDADDDYVHEDEDDNDEDDGDFYVVNSGSNYIEIAAEDGLGTLETLLLEFSPERMQQNVEQLSSQIENLEANEDKLTERVNQTIRTAVGVDMCVICSVSHVNAMLGCGHVFCLGCIMRWRETKRTCPTCNKVSSSVVALSEYEPLPCPFAGADKLWASVWKTQTMTSQVFWLVHTLREIEAQHRRALVVIHTMSDARPLIKVLSKHGVGIKLLAGALPTRMKLMASFADHRTHLLIGKSDVLAGCGCDGATDVVFANSDPELVSDVLSRMRECRDVYTYTSVVEADDDV